VRDRRKTCLRRKPFWQELLAEAGTEVGTEAEAVQEARIHGKTEGTAPSSASRVRLDARPSKAGLRVKANRTGGRAQREEEGEGEGAAAIATGVQGPDHSAGQGRLMFRLCDEVVKQIKSVHPPPVGPSRWLSSPCGRCRE